MSHAGARVTQAPVKPAWDMAEADPSANLKVAERNSPDVPGIRIHESGIQICILQAEKTAWILCVCRNAASEPD